MRKLLSLTLLLATLLTFSACEDKNEPEETNPFVGSWSDIGYSGQYHQHWHDYKLTIKNDNTAERITKFYRDGVFASIEIQDFIYEFDENATRDTIYLYYVTEEGVIKNQRLKGVIIGEHLYIYQSVLWEGADDWDTYNEREYTKI